MVFREKRADFFCPARGICGMMDAEKGDDRMKNVILDGYTENPGDLSWDALRAFGSVTVYDRTPDDDAVIAGRIGEAEIVLTNKCPIRRAVMEACPKLQYISVLATGYNIVDVLSARERGIPVSNVPTYGTAAVDRKSVV